MTARLRVLECLVDSNRALEELRDRLTKAYVEVQAAARRQDVNDQDAADLWALYRRIGGLRDIVYEDRIDDELLALVLRAAEVTT